MGCGRVGSLLARNLASEGHSLAVIDSDPQAFRRLGEDFRGVQIVGLGFDRETLLTARIDQAHAFAAVSSGDNSNIIAARVAREQFNVDTVVARIYDEKRAAVYQRLGIPTVATVPWTADRLREAILADQPETLCTDPTGAMTISMVSYHTSWVGHRLADLMTAIAGRTCFIERFGHTQLPTADCVIQEGDIVYAALPTRTLAEALARAAEEAS